MWSTVVIPVTEDPAPSGRHEWRLVSATAGQSLWKALLSTPVEALPAPEQLLERGTAPGKDAVPLFLTLESVKLVVAGVAAGGSPSRVLPCVRTRRQFPIRVTVVECPLGKLLLVPLIVSVKVPLSGTITVIVVEPVPGTVAGVNVAVGPAGEEAIAKLTVSLKPPVGVIVTVYWTVVPALTLWLLGVAEIEKSLLAVTVTETALDVLPL
jgi:hypothetical protein